MNQLLNRLNLHPQERRLIVAVAAVVFVVLNLWFVWPHFGDWKSTRQALESAKTNLRLYQKETDQARQAELQAKLRELEGEGGTVAASERSLDLMAAILAQQARSGIEINGNFPVNTTSSTKTNDYFERKAQRILFRAEEKQLVDFLVSLGSSNSMIRAHTMRLQPDPTHTRLEGEIMLVASYQKDPLKRPPAPVPSAGTTARKSDTRPARPEATAKPAARSGVKPAGPSTTKPKVEGGAKAKIEPVIRPRTNAVPPPPRDKLKKL